MKDNFWKITTTLPVEYDIKKCKNMFIEHDVTLLDYGDQTNDRKRLIVIDNNVSDFYINEIKSYFDHFNVTYHICILEGGETEKSVEKLLLLLHEMEQFGIQRKNEPIIGIGGGVILDIVGLAASIYRRGVPYIRIPTTLLGIVDVSVAAKTGINFEGRRNRLGSYYPPIATLLDNRFIKTLPDIEIISGLGEIIKMAVIKDNELFRLLENYGGELRDKKFDVKCSDKVIDMSIVGMKEELEGNLWEKNLKRCVDFGHSFSPIIEMRSLIDKDVETLTHGQAVSLDVLFSSIISHNRGLLSLTDLKRIYDTTKLLGLPTFHSSFTNPHLLLESLNDTTKHRNGDQNLPIPVEIGKYVFINDLTYAEIKKSVDSYKEINEG